MLFLTGFKLHITQGEQIYKRYIYVNETGNNSQSCLQGDYSNPCSSVNFALQGIENGTAIYIQKGNYSLRRDDSTDIKDLTDIGIIGTATADEVIIECKDYAGISFYQCDNIEVRSLSLVHCGANRISASQNFAASEFTFIQFRVALYILLSINVTIYNVHIEHSVGTGIVLYNAAGNVKVAYSNITFSSIMDEFGAGGLHIAFTYCIPNDTECSDDAGHTYVPPKYTDKSVYSIHDNVIANNKASSASLSTIINLDDSKSSFMEFDRGGGLSIILKGKATSNTFIICNNNISSNQARHGGGFFFAFYDEPLNNFVSVVNTNIRKNSFRDDKKSRTFVQNTNGGGGGGQVVVYQIFGSQHKNTIEFIKCIFKGNRGITGGGISLEIDYNPPTLVTISDILFDNNFGFLGSALYVIDKSHFSSNISTSGVNISIINGDFTNNIPLCKTHPIPFGSLYCSGIIYLSIPITIFGNVTFTNNSDSAIEIHYSHIIFEKDSNVVFTNNTSEKGGAIALLECSSFLVNCHVNLSFQNNNASLSGGAIYSEACHLSDQCFVQIYNCKLNSNPNFVFTNNNANQQINSLHVGFALQCLDLNKPSILDITLLKNVTFCSNFWKYTDSNCLQEVKSDFYFMIVSTDYATEAYPGAYTMLPINIYDGWGKNVSSVNLVVCIMSGLAKFIESSNYAMSDCSTTNFKEIILKVDKTQLNSTKCKDYINQSVELTVSLENQQFILGLELNLKECPKHLAEMDDECSQCSFTKQLAFNRLSCISADNKHCPIYNNLNPKNEKDDCYFNSLVYIDEGNCVSQLQTLNKSRSIIAGHCPYFYPNQIFCEKVLTLLDQHTYLLDICSMNRSGTLCGKCMTGYAIGVQSPSLTCGHCHKLSGLIYIAVQMIPLTTFIIFILLFHITITSPGMNAFIFFSQIITLDFPGTMYPSWVRDATIVSEDQVSFLRTVVPLTLPYSIWNMNFLVLLQPYKSSGICISHTMDTIEVVGFQYVIAIYPLCILLLIYIWISFYENGFRSVHYITRPIHQLLARMWQALEIRPSFVDSCAVIFIVTFTKFALTSLKLLHYTTWYSLDGSQHGNVFYYDGSLDYFHKKHLGFGIMAILFLLFFAACPIIYFLLYPCMWFQKLLDKCKFKHDGLVAITDTFMGNFRDRTMSSFDYRYCAGFYLLFRVICICVYYIPNIQVLLIVETGLTLVVAGFFMICRPYKQNISNLTDFSIFLLLSVLSGLCLVEPNKHLGLQISIGLLFVPFLVFSLYVLYLILKRVKMCGSKFLTRKQQANTDNEQTSDEEPLLDDQLESSFADRVENPNLYDEKHSVNIPLVSNQTGGDSSLSFQATAYNSRHSAGKRRYGSIQFRPNKHSTN